MIRESTIPTAIRAAVPFLGPVVGLVFIAIFGINSHAGFVEKVLMTIGVAFLADRFFRSVLRVDRLVRGRFNLM